MKSWKNAVLNPESPLLSAIKCLNDSASRIVLVTDTAMRLLGVVTDGDLRRAILRSVSLETPISEIMNLTPTVVGPNATATEISKLMREKTINRIPVIDEAGKLVGLHSLEDILAKKCHDNTVVVMAGGLGTRLSPLTDEVPKPLLPVGGKPILEIILSNCIQHGFSNFYFALNYKAEMIKDYFGDGSKWGVKINYLEEDQQLGTAGALCLLPELATDNPMLVLNGDLLTNVDLGHLLDFHSDQGAVATMGVKQYDVEVPYGVICTEDATITSIKEKPVHSFMVNAGVYVIEQESLARIPKDIKFNMTDLFGLLMQSNQKVTAFPIHEYWLDIGKMQDFERAQIDVQKFF